MFEHGEADKALGVRETFCSCAQILVGDCLAAVSVIDLIFSF